MSAAMSRPLVRTGASSVYVQVLGWLFAALNSVRVLSYLPTIAAIHASGDSAQHSLWTWCLWMGSNLTMAAWLFEHNGRRLNGAVVVSLCNTVMCLITASVIGWYRL
jgi:hypothetical protein